MEIDMSKKESFYEKEYHKIVGIALSGIFVIVAAQLGSTWLTSNKLDDKLDTLSNTVSVLKDRSDQQLNITSLSQYYFSEADSLDIANLYK